MIVSAPLTARSDSSLTVPVVAPPIVGASFAPVIVIVTVCVVPSSDTAVNVSFTVSPKPSASTVGSAMLSM